MATEHNLFYTVDVTLVQSMKNNNYMNKVYR